MDDFKLTLKEMESQTIDTVKKRKWVYSRTNSKGEKKFKKFTGETVEFVEKYLIENGIDYEIKLGATMVWIYFNNKKYQYFYTTGRWGCTNGYIVLTHRLNRF